MRTPPSQWPGRLLALALTVLAVAVALYAAARLIVAVLPVLLGAAAVGLLGVAAYSAFRSRTPR
jgi:hypothetical protein